MPTAPAAAAPEAGERILFFHDRGCLDCALVKDALLEPFASKLELSLSDVCWKDVEDRGAVRELLGLERSLGFASETLAPILIARGKAYCGLAAIRRAVEGE